MAETRLPANAVEQFRRDGYLIARGFASLRLCARMSEVVKDHVARDVPPVEYEADVGYPGAPQSRNAEGGRTVRRLLRACSRDPLFHAWATSASLSGCFSQLLAGPAMLVQAHHNCIMTKHPRYGSGTSWHRDIRYWCFERPDLISVWLALGTEREENGGLWVVPGSHALEFDRGRFDDALFFREDHMPNRALLEERVPIELDAGDVLFFHCRLLHSAGRNHGAETKYSAVFTYCDQDNRPIADTRSASLPLLALPIR